MCIFLHFSEYKLSFSITLSFVINHYIIAYYIVIVIIISFIIFIFSTREQCKLSFTIIINYYNYIVTVTIIIILL